ALSAGAAAPPTHPGNDVRLEVLAVVGGPHPRKGRRRLGHHPASLIALLKAAAARGPEQGVELRYYGRGKPGPREPPSTELGEFVPLRAPAVQRRAYTAARPSPVNRTPGGTQNPLLHPAEFLCLERFDICRPRPENVVSPRLPTGCLRPTDFFSFFLSGC